MEESFGSPDNNQSSEKLHRVLVRIVDPESVPPKIVIPGWSSNDIPYQLDVERLAELGIENVEGSRFFGRINLGAEDIGQLCLEAESYEVTPKLPPGYLE